MFGLGTPESLVLLVVAVFAGAALLLALLGSTAVNDEDDSGSPFVGLGAMLFLTAVLVALVVVF